jgi:hypothetical protein
LPPVRVELFLHGIDAAGLKLNFYYLFARIETAIETTIETAIETTIETTIEATIETTIEKY